MTELLQVKGLTKSFGSVHAVKSIDFSIQEGRCVALLGPNGAGKTTTIRMLTGLLAPTSGEVRFHSLARGEDHRSLIGYLPQTPAFHNGMSGMEYVVYSGRLCGLSASDARKRAMELLERVGLASAAKRRVGGYSGGMKQRLGLAQALVHHPKLLVMDEPVSALDPLGRREVLRLLQELKSETTVLFSTHVLHDAEELCDDVVIIRDGEVALQGSLAAIRNEHRRPVIELKLEDAPHAINWAQSFLQKSRTDELRYSWLSEAELQGNRLYMTASHMDVARQGLMEELTEHKVPFSRLEVGYSSLEDLFMKVVSG
ncbi:ABC transporter ATP-binding protein [Paenibacillus paeoniae]|uniref:ABC transporter ATP-binding protein n=1 Tax=Paenibacillus paeoniae TaxID=2292705 RepID=A0A371P6K2_9BACL|nr:ABC transporter ATP-binding protein [Paenibacillus paeoniae]REK71571.1 ABC transporter ATP-binding protein [Paenibacillus paeoniae]